MQPAAYFHADVYHGAVDKLDAIARTFDPAAPHDLRTMIIQVLGEELGIWPMSAFSGEDEGEVIVIN